MIIHKTEDTWTFTHRCSRVHLAIAELSSWPFTDCQLIPKIKVLWFARLNVPKPHRRKGIGTMLLKEICKHADQSDVGILNAPNPVDIPRNILLSWYKCFGFIELNQSLLFRKPDKKENK
jgi:hypothetical protein